MPFSWDNSVLGRNCSSSVTFCIGYEKERKTVVIHSIKVNNLPVEFQRGTNRKIVVQFILGKWKFETSVKTAYASSQTIVWNEHFSKQMKLKIVGNLTLHAKVLGEGTDENFGVVSLDMTDVNLDVEMVCVLPFDAIISKYQGQIQFFVHHSKNEVTVSNMRVKHLPRVLQGYSVRVHLEDHHDCEKSTLVQRSPSWNEELTLQGHRTKQMVTLGEVTLDLKDVQHKQHGRLMYLEKPKMPSIYFFTKYTTHGSTGKLGLQFDIRGLQHLTIPNRRTNVYVQVKQLQKDRIVKKKQTRKALLAKNVSYHQPSFDFEFGSDEERETRFNLRVKTQKRRLFARKHLLGQVVVGPLSQAKWYRDFKRDKEQDKEHNLFLELNE